jgi:hypothetical protein
LKSGPPPTLANRAERIHKMDFQTNDTAPASKASQERKAVYTIVKRDASDRGFWVRIGSGWVNRDGSLNLRLDALPVNGQLHVRDIDPEGKGRE